MQPLGPDDRRDDTVPKSRQRARLTLNAPPQPRDLLGRFASVTTGGIEHQQLRLRLSYLNSLLAISRRDPLSVAENSLATDAQSLSAAWAVVLENRREGELSPPSPDAIMVTPPSQISHRPYSRRTILLLALIGSLILAGAIRAFEAFR